MSGHRFKTFASPHAAGLWLSWLKARGGRVVGRAFVDGKLVIRY